MTDTPAAVAAATFVSTLIAVCLLWHFVHVVMHVMRARHARAIPVTVNMAVAPGIPAVLCVPGQTSPMSDAGDGPCLPPGSKEIEAVTRALAPVLHLLPVPAAIVVSHDEQGRPVPMSESRFAAVNAALADALGYPPDVLTQKTFGEFISPEHLAETEIAVRESRNGTNDHSGFINSWIVGPLAARSGQPIWLRWCAAGQVTFAVDVTYEVAATRGIMSASSPDSHVTDAIARLAASAATASPAADDATLASRFTAFALALAAAAPAA